MSISPILISKLSFIKSIACWSVFSSLFSAIQYINIQFRLEYCSWWSILFYSSSILSFIWDSVPFSSSIFFPFPLLSCSYASNFSPINNIALFTSCSASSPLIWLSLDFLTRSNFSFTCCYKLHKQFAKFNTQSVFFKPRQKHRLKCWLKIHFYFLLFVSLAHNQFQTFHCWEIFSWMISRRKLLQYPWSAMQIQRMLIENQFAKLLLQKYSK